MQVRDGFIVGIFNYCDRWCEVCAFTSRCRLFADTAEIQASLDPALKPIVEAPPLPEDAPPALPPWMEEMIQEMNAVAESAVGVDDHPPPREPPAEHLEIENRAMDYCLRVYSFLKSRDPDLRDGLGPGAVVSWFHSLIPAKIHRAIRGLAEDGSGERDGPPDYDGSAKVALLGIERSHAAWLALVERGVVTQGEVESFIADLVWIADALERVFPKAHTFVRPAFDEPDKVAMLLARERQAG